MSSCKSHVEEALEERPLVLDLGRDALVDPVEHEGHGAHGRGLQHGGVASLAFLDGGGGVDQGVGAGITRIK